MNRLLDELCRDIAWACPNCGFLVFDMMRSHIRSDPLCQCGARRWSEFRPEMVLRPGVPPPGPANP